MGGAGGTAAAVLSSIIILCVKTCIADGAGPPAKGPGWKALEAASPELGGGGFAAGAGTGSSCQLGGSSVIVIGGGIPPPAATVSPGFGRSPSRRSKSLVSASTPSSAAPASVWAAGRRLNPMPPLPVGSSATSVSVVVGGG